MTDSTVAAWRTKLIWGVIGLAVVGFWGLGNKLKSNERITLRAMLGETFLQIVNAFMAMKLVTLGGWQDENIAWIVVALAVIGQKTTLHILRSLILKYLNVGPEDTVPRGIHAAPDAVAPAPAADKPIDPRAVPIAQLGARFGSYEAQRGRRRDPDQDVIDKLGDGG